MITGQMKAGGILLCTVPEPPEAAVPVIAGNAALRIESVPEKPVLSTRRCPPTGLQRYRSEYRRCSRAYASPARWE